MCALGSGIEKVIEKNITSLPGIHVMIRSPEIYIPIFCFIILIILTFFLRKFFFKK